MPLVADVRVLGFRGMRVCLTPEAIAHGFADVIPERLDLIVGYGRGEEDRPATIDLPITMRLAEPPEPCDWLRIA